MECGPNWKLTSHLAFALSAFVNQFDNFLSLDATGQTVDDLPEYAYTQVKARFSGVEASGNAHLLAGPQTLDLGLRVDVVKAENTTTGQPLPRIAPAQMGASLAWARGPWNLKLDNLGDSLAYSASSILTQTAPGKAPLPGRSLTLRVQVKF